MALLKELSKPGKSSFSIPEFEAETEGNIPASFLRDEIDLPELTEPEVMRHFTNLSRMNFGVDNGFYPLGSCTMKYNPKINEETARIPEFNIHPLSEDNQGCLEIIFETERVLAEITGMKAFSCIPAAGAHGELAAIMMMKAYFKRKNEVRKVVLIPDSAHGTNPASAALCGFECVTVMSSADGGVDLGDLKAKMDENVVALMLTNPNTLGLFDRNVLEITQIVHDKGGLCYLDGANMNAMLGVVRPADLGFDIMHLNLHKTFSTPHGGGGPGAGPIGCVAELEAFLPVPRVEKTQSGYEMIDDIKESIGRIHAFYGNFNVLVKAYTYILGLGAEGLRKVAENAVLNANYMKEKLRKYYHLAYDDRPCQHEFVISDKDMPNGVTTNDVAKRLLDYGFHPPTVYFPLIVSGAMMIEPTETESIETMDAFIEAMIKIKEEAKNDPEIVKTAPQRAPIKKLDAVLAARKPILKWG